MSVFQILTIRPAVAEKRDQQAGFERGAVSAAPEFQRGLQAGKLGAATPAGLAGSDWSAIREAQASARHRVQKHPDGGHLARNPGQQWNTHFDGRGFLTTPEVGGWCWGLELRHYGFAGQPVTPVRSPEVSTDQNNLTYHWDDRMSEWFLNDGRGLEQGWTIKERPGQPAKAGEALTLTLHARGTLRPRIQPGGLSVAFATEMGVTALTYGGLKAWDADHQPLSVRFEAVAGNDQALQVAVEECHARYPITIDPVAQQSLQSSNLELADRFGYAVGISGDTVVVGAPTEGSGAQTIDGNQADNGAAGAGAAYVFVRSNGVWTQQAYLKASNAEALDGFGWSVAIQGDTIAVGAIGEKSNARGVNGDQADNSLNQAGAVYVFVRNGGVWSQQAYLKASNTDLSDAFGIAVAMSGETIAVGAYGEGSNATGVNGNQANNDRFFSGAAYVFVRNGITWTQQAYLKGPEANTLRFAKAISLSGDTIVCGSDGDFNRMGRAYVFLRSGANWSQQATLRASNGEDGDAFGWSVGLAGDTLAVGAPFEASDAVGVDGDQANNNADGSGAVYVFRRRGVRWSQRAYLKASNSLDGLFGQEVAVTETGIVVGADRESSGASGVDGNQADTSLGGSGAAYAFIRRGTSWVQQAYLKSGTPLSSAHFGFAIAADADTAVIGGEFLNAARIGSAHVFAGLGGAVAEPEPPVPAALPRLYEPFFNFGTAITSGSGFATGSRWGLGGFSIPTTLQYPGLATSGGSVSLPSSNTTRSFVRNLSAENQAGANGTTRYFSFLVRPQGTLGAGVFGGYFGINLITASGPNLFIGKPGSTPAAPYAMEEPGGVNQVASSLVPVVGQTVLLVVKAEFGAAPAGRDRFTLFLNPPPGQREPAVGVVKENTNLGTIVRITLTSSAAHSIDELRMGETFEEVTTVPEDIVYEGFDYPAGSVQGLGGGIGFAEYWHLGGFNAVQNANFGITTAGLQVPGLAVSGGGFIASATAPAFQLSGMTRMLATPIGIAGTTRYLSFLARPEGTLGEGNGGGWFGVGLESPPEPQLFIGKVSEGAGKYVIEERGGARQVVSPVVPALGETVLMVVKAEFAVSGNDRFTLFVNPVPGAPEPANGLIKENASIGLISGLTLYSSGAYSLDEIRIGPTFGSVTPVASAGLSAQQTWRQTYFGSTANTGNGADTADPDNDGVPNLMEYAFGQSPTDPGSRAIPEWLLNGESLTLSFTPPEGVTGLLYTAEQNESLAANGWTAVPNTATPPVHHFSVPREERSRQYLRLRISVP